jgi:calcineurin-like phosphoesterase family protein
LHLGHKNILRFDQRPFFTVEEMDAEIIKNWNRAVTPADEVYILGDMFWKNEGAAEVLRSLHGRKYLVLGNHDRINSDMQREFVWIKEIETIKDGDKHVVLCHYPIAHWKNQRNGYIHLYGHIHQSRDSRQFETYCKMCLNQGIPFEAYNVGCMCEHMSYTPRTLEEIIKRCS